MKQLLIAIFAVLTFSNAYAASKIPGSTGVDPNRLYGVDRVVTLGPGNTPPGLYKPKPAPPKPEFKGTCTVLPCGQKPVQFVPSKR